MIEAAQILIVLTEDNYFLQGWVTNPQCCFQYKLLYKKAQEIANLMYLIYKAGT